MGTKNQNFSLYEGDSANITFNITDMDNGGKPLDLTGTVIRWAVVKEPHRSQVVEKTSEDGGIVIENPASGQAVVKLTSEDSDRLKRGAVYTHFLRTIDNLNQRSTVAEGKITIE